MNVSALCSLRSFAAKDLRRKTSRFNGGASARKSAPAVDTRSPISDLRSPISHLRALCASVVDHPRRMSPRGMNHRDAEDTEKAMAGQSVFRPESVRDGLHTDSDSTFDRMVQASEERDFGGTLARVPCLDHLPALKLHVLKQALPRRTSEDADDIEMLIRRNGLGKSTRPLSGFCELRDAARPSLDLNLPDAEGFRSLPPLAPARWTVWFAYSSFCLAGRTSYRMGFSLSRLAVSVGACSNRSSAVAKRSDVSALR